MFPSPSHGGAVRRSKARGAGNASGPEPRRLAVPGRFEGCPGRVRTSDLLIQSQALCQLSYGAGGWHRRWGAVPAGRPS
jgi:hypothetical protein